MKEGPIKLGGVNRSAATEKPKPCPIGQKTMNTQNLNNTEHSKTPRTDEAAFVAGLFDGREFVVSRVFARTLELELAEAKEEIERVRKEREELSPPFDAYYANRK